MSFSLGSGAAAPNLGQTGGLPEQPRPCIKRRLVPAPRRYGSGADAGIAWARAEQLRCRSGFPPGYGAGGFKILSDEKAGPFRRESLMGKGAYLGIDAGFGEGRWHLVTCVPAVPEQRMLQWGVSAPLNFQP